MAAISLGGFIFLGAYDQTRSFLLELGRESPWITDSPCLQERVLLWELFPLRWAAVWPSKQQNAALKSSSAQITTWRTHLPCCRLAGMTSSAWFPEFREKVMSTAVLWTVFSEPLNKQVWQRWVQALSEPSFDLYLIFHFLPPDSGISQRQRWLWF